MLNPFEDIRWHPSVQEIRRNGVVLFVGMEVIASLLFFAFGRAGVSLIFAGIGPALLLLSLVPWTGRWVYVGIFFLAACFGIVVSNVLLVFFFFFLLTPVAWLLRGRKVKPVAVKEDPDVISNWQERSSQEDPTRYFKQY